MSAPTPFRDADLPVVHGVLESSPNCVVVVGADGRVTHANSRALDLLGYARDEVLGRPAHELFPEASTHAEQVAAYLDAPRPRASGEIRPVDVRRRDGSTFPAEIALTPLPTTSGTQVIVGVTDVTQARESAARLRDLSRAYLTLARLNQATVRARTPEELYAESCRVAVEEGGYLAAWVARRGPGDGVETVALAGVLDEYVAGLGISLDPDNPLGRGPTARALREGRSYYSQDFRADAATGPWQERAAGHGIRASASLPVRCRGEVVAVFTLWSARPYVFDERMRGLLESLGENLSFALDGFDAADRLAHALEQRQDLLGRLVAAQDEERARIAAGVHDDSVQALATVDLRLGLLARQVTEAAPDLAPAVARLQQTVGAVSGGLRDLLFELEPVTPGASLVDLVHQAAAHVFEGADVHWSVLGGPADGAAPARPERRVLEQAVRITREALVRVRARTASTVVVSVRSHPDGVEVVLRDNGASPVDDDPGLARLRDRAEAAGGRCTETRDERTELRLWLPHVAARP